MQLYTLHHMYLKFLHLRHFRNYHDQAVEFTAPKTILLGENAQGKSNLLESVELLATLRSHRSSRDRELVQDGENIAQVEAVLERDLGTTDMSLRLRRAGRRTLTLNGEIVKRQADMLGVMNAVEFSSLDLDLVRGGPGIRRDWVDTLLMQLEPIYDTLLTEYQHILKQRNALLKHQARAHRQSDYAHLDKHLDKVDTVQAAIWDAQLAATGTHVIRRRRRALERLAPLAAHWHEQISNRREILEVRYSPNIPVDEDDPETVRLAFLEQLQQKAIAEQIQGTTLAGPHRDEIEFTINQTPARQYGSQGQQRTLVLALKLAELSLLETVVGEPPLLLLDDVLAELDLNRQNKLLETIQERFQTLITTTHLGAFDAAWLNSSQILTVKSGQILDKC
jgi:DNA replication and repair protein RecF